MGLAFVLFVRRRDLALVGLLYMDSRIRTKLETWAEAEKRKK